MGYSKKEKEPFNVIKSIINRGLFHPNPDVNFYDFDKILVDLDSILSIVLRYDLPYDKDARFFLASDILDAMKLFIESYIDSNKIIMYYNMDNYKKLIEIYPDWCKDRIQRYHNEYVIGFIHKILLSKLKILAETQSNFYLIKSPDAPILDIFNEIVLNPSQKYVVLSRDPHFNCILAYNDISIYNGLDLYDRRNFKLVKDIPDIHHTLLPYYYLVRGIDRDEYRGVATYGHKKTEKYIKDNMDTIIIKEDPLYTTVECYRQLFYIKELK